MLTENNLWKHLIPLDLLIVGANLYIIWYLLVFYPSECLKIAIVSKGAITCGLNWGACLIVAICCGLILITAGLIIKRAFNSLNKDF